MGALEALGDQIWVADGPVAIDLLVVPYPTRMTVVRLADGGLWIASPTTASYDELEAITALGEVRHLLAPTPRHYWRLERWHQLFPDAQLWTSPLGPFTPGRRRTLPARTLGDAAPAAWAGQIDQTCYRGLGFAEIAFFHRASRTLLLEDIIGSHGIHRGQPLVNALIRVGGIEQPGGVPCDIRAITRDRTAARAWAERVLDWDFDKVVAAHGPVVRTDAKEMVRQAFGWLLRGR